MTVLFGPSIVALLIILTLLYLVLFTNRVMVICKMIIFSFCTCIMVLFGSCMTYLEIYSVIIHRKLSLRYISIIFGGLVGGKNISL